MSEKIGDTVRDLVTPANELDPLGVGFLREILDSLYTFVGVLTPDGTIVEANRAALRAASLTIDEVIGRRFEDTYWWSYSPEVQAQLRSAIDRSALCERSRYDARMRLAEDLFIDVDFSLAPMRDSLGRVAYLIPSCTDITERKEAENQLREQAALLDHAQDAILVCDLEDRLLFWNRQAERTYGWKSEEVLGKNICDLLYRENREPCEAAKESLLAQGEWEGELLHRTRDGKEIIAECRWTLLREANGDPRSVLVINTDITDKKKIEAQLLRAQRMEGIGTLAGGIAHDINNLLSPIVMSIRLLQTKVVDDDSQRILATLQSSAERCAGLVKQVLSFARGVQGDHVLLQPRHLIREIVKVLKDTLPKSIEVRLGGAEDLWVVSGDPMQLHQVMMNLCVNARDAMPNGGKLSILAENVIIDENYARMNLEARAGQFVLMTIADTGTGIPPHVLDKIFEPFFTTRELGKGTGLGLSTALGIVKGHRGFINVYSEFGHGAQFRIYLPAATPEEKKTDEGQEAKLPRGHGDLILVVDDEEAILQITRRTLEAYGYRVLTAADGTEAMALFAQHRAEVKVVVTDIMMPFMDGPTTIRELQKLDPLVKLIVTSGFADNGRRAESAGVPVKMFLAKPYTADKLLRALADLIQSD